MPSLPTQSRRASTVQLVAAFAAVYVIWGSTYLGIRYAIETLPPFLMAGTRFVLAGLLLYGWMRLRGAAERPTARNWLAATIVGGLLLLGGNGLICWAEIHVPSGLTALLVATVPLWMVVLDWLLWRGPKPTVIITLGLAVGLIGVLVLINPMQIIGQPIHPWGATAILIACVSWALGSLYSRRAALPKSILLATAMEMIAGGTLQLVTGTARGEWAMIDLGHVSLTSVLAFFYLVVFGSLIGFSAYIWLLSKVSPAAVSTYAFVNPIVAVFLGWAVAHEPLEPRSLAAAALIIAAIVMITVRRSASKPLAIAQNATATFGADAAHTTGTASPRAPQFPPAPPARGAAPHSPTRQLCGTTTGNAE